MDQKYNEFVPEIVKENKRICFVKFFSFRRKYYKILSEICDMAEMLEPTDENLSKLAVIKHSIDVQLDTLSNISRDLRFEIICSSQIVQVLLKLSMNLILEKVTDFASKYGSAL